MFEGSAFGESVVGEFDERVGGFFGDGTTKGAGDEVTDDAPGIGFGSGGGDVVKFDTFAVAHPDGGAGFEGDGVGISKEGFLGNRREGLVEGAVGFDPDDADSGALFVFVAPSDVVGVDPGDDVEGFSFPEEGLEFDDTGLIGGSGDVEHSHEASFSGAEERAGVDGDGEGAVTGVVRPDGEAAAVVTVLNRVNFINADGRPSGGELDEGVVGFDDAALLFGKGILVVRVVDDPGAAGFGWEGRNATDGGFEGDVGGLKVAFHQDGGEGEAVRDVVKALNLSVFGKEFGEGSVDAEEVANGVFVFDSVEATERDRRLGFLEKGSGESGDRFLKGVGVGAGFFLGGHVAIFEDF